MLFFHFNGKGERELKGHSNCVTLNFVFLDNLLKFSKP